MADQQATELSQPYIGALDLPAAFVTAQFPAIFVLFSLVVFPVRRDQLDAALLPSLTQRVGVITTIRYDSFRFLPRPSFRPGTRTSASVASASVTSAGEALSSRTPSGIPSPSPIPGSLTTGLRRRGGAPSTFCPCRAWSYRLRRPLFRRCEAAVKKGFIPFQQALCVQSAQQASPGVETHTFILHCFSRRQQVEGDGYLSGKKRHAAPVCSTQRMPSRQARFDAQGRPRLSRLRGGSGSKGPTNSHCASVNSICRFFMAEDHHLNRLTRKNLSVNSNSLPPRDQSAGE